MVARVAVCQHVMQGSGQSVKIGTGISITLVLFWWGITRCTEGRGLFPLRVARFVGTGNTKIDEVRSFVFCSDDDIGGFDVAVHNGRRFLGKVVEDVQHLRGIAKGFSFFHGLIDTVHAFFEVFAFYVFLNHEVARPFLEVVGHVWYQGVIEVRKGSYFAFEVPYVFLEFGWIGVV